MAKQRKKLPPVDAPSTSAVAESGRPAVWLRVLLSLWVCWHLFVLFVSPLSVPPASQLVIDVAQSKAVRWYSDQFYLNHGYHFFGPEPPINHLVRYQVVNDAGEMVAEGEFPNNDQQWPRLFYHRHMMLADQASLGPGDIDPDQWLRYTLRGYARHLLRQHDGAEARIEYVRHSLLFPTQSQRGDDPNDPGMFTSVVSLSETAADLERPMGVPAGAAAERLPMGDPQ